MERENLVFDKSINHFEQHNDGVVVTFTKSKEMKKYNLLVATNGLGSKIRDMMLNTKPQEQLFDEGVHVAYFTIKSNLLQGSCLAKWYNTMRGRVVFLRPDPDPIGRTRYNLMNMTTSRNMKTKERHNRALCDGNKSYIKLMEEMYGDIRSPRLQEGCVVLLGDAGYATPRIDASLAITGGYVLARELLAHPGGMKTSLGRYEEIMLPFAKSLQDGGDPMWLLNPQAWWGTKIQNAILGFVT